MYYNIDYECAAVFLLALILISKYKLLRSSNIVERYYWGVVAVYFVTNSLDIVAACCYSDVIPVNDSWMLVIETAYLLFAMYAVYFQLRVICFRVGYNSETFKIANFAIVALMTILLIINIGMRFIFEYIDNEFVGYAFFSSIYIVSGVMFAETAFVIWNQRNAIRPKIAVFSSLCFIFPIICILIQFLDDRLLLSGIGATAASVMFSFTLGDQDYAELQETLKELEVIKEQDMEKQLEIEAAYRVKQRFMENASDEMRMPVEEIRKTNRKLEEICQDSKIDEYSARIEEASNQLLVFMDELLAE